MPRAQQSPRERTGSVSRSTILMATTVTLYRPVGPEELDVTSNDPRDVFRWPAAIDAAQPARAADRPRVPGGDGTLADRWRHHTGSSASWPEAASIYVMIRAPWIASVSCSPSKASWPS
jgi:hypothetical protein